MSSPDEKDALPFASAHDAGWFKEQSDAYRELAAFARNKGLSAGIAPEPEKHRGR